MKLCDLRRVWEFWQKEPSLPSEYAEFNPFELALDKSDLKAEQPPDPHRIPLEELREAIQNVSHMRDRAIVALQFKLGLRAGEVANIRIGDLHISGRHVADHYPNPGTNPMLDGRENAIYAPPRADKTLPWDVRDALRRYEDDLVAGSVATLPDELRPDADVVSLEDVAAERGISTQALEDVPFPEHERVGQTLVRDSVLEELRAELEPGISLEATEELFETYDISEDSALLSELGYRVEWDGLSGGTVRSKQ